MRTFLLALGVLLLPLAGCPGGGDVYGPRPPAGYPDGQWGGGTSWDDLFPGYGGVPDTSAPGPDASTPPPPGGDAAPPPPPPPPLDLGTQLPAGEGLGCSNQQPCSGGMVCFSGTCRAKCTQGGVCGVHGACPATHGCVMTTSGFAICVPALSQPGQTCSASAYCPVGFICGSTGGAFKCLPTCTATPCGTGGSGQCIATRASCSICSTL